jgi:hypothetical protein
MTSQTKLNVPAVSAELLSDRSNGQFESEKRAQLFMRAHNETLPVAMCVCDEDCSPVKITVKA